MQTARTSLRGRSFRSGVGAALALLAAPSLAFAPTDGDELRAVYRESLAVTVTAEDWMNLAVGEVSMRINGNEMEGEMIEELKAGMPSGGKEERLVTTTWFDAVEEGRPVRARRLFVESTRTESEGGDEEESDGALVGRTLLLTATDELGAADARVADEDDEGALDDVHLTGHRLTHESDLYLPDEPVEVGDTWSLDDDDVRRLLQEDGPVLFADDGEEDDFLEALEQASDVKGSVEYVAREEVDGTPCAVLVVTLEFEASDVEMDPSDMGMLPEEGMEASATMGMRMSGEERVWISADGGLPLRSKAELRGEMRMSMVMTRADVGLEIAVDVAFDVEGGREYRTSVE